MDYTFSSTPKHSRLIKKLSVRQKALLESYEEQAAIIIKNPGAGYPLVGNYRGYYCYDWTFRGVSLRICFRLDQEQGHITFVYFGTRENFYEELGRLL